VSKGNGRNGSRPVVLPGRPVNDAFRQAHAHHQAGRFAEAEPLYRGVLARDRFNDEALHLLGVLLYQTGRAAEGEGLVRQAIERRKRVAPYHDHLGVILRTLGRPAEAAEAQARALALEPNNPTIQSNLGATLIDLGRPGEALPLLEKATSAQAGFANAWNNLGLARQRLGQMTGAVAAYSRAIELEPRSAVYLCNLGSAQQELGLSQEAQATYRRGLAIDARSADLWNNLGHLLVDEAPEDAKRALDQAVRLRPDYADAWHNQGHLAAKQRRDEEARKAYERALELVPTHFRALSDLASLVQRRGELDRAATLVWQALQVRPQSIDTLAHFIGLFPYADAGVMAEVATLERLLTRALTDGTIPGSAMFATAEFLLRAHPAWAGLPRTVDAPTQTDALEAVGGDTLLLALLRATVGAEAGFEVRLRWLRRALLDAHDTPALQGLAAALAANAFTAEYVLEEHPGETVRVDALGERIGSSEAPVEAFDVLRWACWRPLLDHPAVAALQAAFSGHPHLGPLLRRTVDAPNEERALAASMPTLLPIERETSIAVRAQYEANPYPRWTDVLRVEPRSWDASFRMRWPGLATTPMLPARRVLVAGGGTGQEPIRLAVMHPELEVHVIDLSRRSLAYGARQAKRFGVDGRVHFAQADLLDLEQLGDRLGDFDRVYSSGVLHHLADPMEGLRAVVSRLKPGGVAQLALYSRAARASVNEGRAAAQQLGLGTELSDVRALRRFVLEHADRDAFRRIMGFRDFYSTSECRDLLLHVQEHQFDLAEVAGMLQAVGLKFLVFTFEDPRVDLRFRAEFGESRQSDLDAWNAYEAKYPDTFKAMYQFLAVKTPPDEA